MKKKTQRKHCIKCENLMLSKRVKSLKLLNNYINEIYINYFEKNLQSIIDQSASP